MSDYSESIAEFIRTKGITRCPTACVLPTQGTVAAADRAALEDYATAKEQKRETRPRNLALFLQRADNAEQFRQEVLRPVVEELSGRGITRVRAITEVLNARRIPTTSGKGIWHTNTVSEQLKRMGNLRP